MMDDENLVQEIITDLEHNQDKNLKINITKYREVFNHRDIEHSQLSMSNITYCDKAISDLKLVHGLFVRDKEKIMTTNEFPNLTLIITKDNFEVDKEDAEYEW